VSRPLRGRADRRRRRPFDLGGRPDRAVDGRLLPFGGHVDAPFFGQADAVPSARRGGLAHFVRKRLARRVLARRVLVSRQADVRQRLQFLAVLGVVDVAGAVRLYRRRVPRLPRRFVRDRGRPFDRVAAGDPARSDHGCEQERHHDYQQDALLQRDRRPFPRRSRGRPVDRLRRWFLS